MKKTISRYWYTQETLFVRFFSDERQNMNALDIKRGKGMTSIRCPVCGWLSCLYTDDAKTMKKWEEDIKKEHEECAGGTVCHSVTSPQLDDQRGGGQLLLIEDKAPYDDDEPYCPPMGMQGAVITTNRRLRP